ncbi:MAG: hypothetical protein WC701_04920 [Kiritimatiellales bacterium]|jgi:hypothetical protein
MKKSRCQAITEILIIVLFCGIISLPFVGTVFHWDFYPYQGENRKLAEFPDFKTLSLAELPEAFDAYCNDHFGFRNTFLRRYTRLSKQLLKSGKKDVVLGSDNWMFLDTTLKDYMGFRKWPETTVKKLSDTLLSRKEQLALKGIPYLLVIAPDKIKIYPDKKPELNPATNTIRRIDQLKSALPESFKTNLLYLCDALKAARAEKETYYANDTHWTDYGAYIGYRETIRRMQTWRPDLKALPLDSLNITAISHEGDLVAMNGSGKPIPAECLNLNESQKISVTDYPVGPAQNWHIWPKNVAPPQLFTNPAGRGRLLIFHDSFGEPLMRFIPSNFEQTAFFWIYSSPEALDALIAEFHPDFVVEIHVERRIDLFLDTPGSDRAHKE